MRGDASRARRRCVRACARAIVDAMDMRGTGCDATMRTSSARCDDANDDQMMTVNFNPNRASRPESRCKGTAPFVAACP